MWVELVLCLVLAHLVADFALQTNKICKDKAEKKWKSLYHYGHAMVVFGLSWLVAFDWGFWWCALIIGVSHLAIDMWKSYRPENVVWFALDQILHLGVIADAVAEAKELVANGRVGLKGCVCMSAKAKEV